MAKKKNFTFTQSSKHITFDVPEKQVATFLKELGDQDILFDEISIEKPSLEDYFLQAAKQKKE